MAYKPKSNFVYPKPTNLSSNNGLIAAYNFTKTGNTMTDISGNGKNATLTRTVTTKDGLQFCGTACKAVLGDLSSVRSIQFRIKFKTTSEKILEKAANSGLIYTSSGTLTAADFANKYVDGVSGSTVVAGQWHNIALTSATDVNFSAATLGLNNTTYGSFEIADLRFYLTTLTVQEIKNYHNSFVKPVLVEDFKYLPCDGSSVVPKDWIKGTGVYKGIEITSQDSVLKHIDKGTKMLQCVTAGTIAFPSKQSYGTWEFDIFKGADGNQLCNYFISNLIDINNINVNTYIVYLHINEALKFSRVTGVTELLKFDTVSSYISNTTYYRIRITRTKAGVFTMLIKGGAFTPTAGYDGWTLVSTTGGSGTNPVTDNIYTTSNYLVLDLDAGDRAGNFTFYNGIKQ